MKRNFIYLSILLLMMWIVDSCTYRKVDVNKISPSVTGNVYYDPEIKGILTASCTCHLPGGTAINNADLSSYDKVKSEAQRMQRALAPGGLMDGFAAKNQRDIIDAWIMQGTLENANSASGNIIYGANQP